MRVIFGDCVAFQPCYDDSPSVTRHQQPSPPYTLVWQSQFSFFKQHKFEVRFKVTEQQQQSEMRRQAPSPLKSMALTGELAGSNATSSILIARLSFSDSFADVLRARSACNNQAVNMSKFMGKRGNAVLPTQQQPFKLLYSLHIQYWITRGNAPTLLSAFTCTVCSPWHAQVQRFMSDAASNLPAKCSRHLHLKMWETFTSSLLSLVHSRNAVQDRRKTCGLRRLDTFHWESNLSCVKLTKINAKLNTSVSIHFFSLSKTRLTFFTI